MTMSEEQKPAKADWRGMFDREYLGAWDLPRDVTLVIREVRQGTLQQGTKKDKKPIIYFNRTDKGLAGNKTNCKIIAKLYGNDTRDWIGKPITLYATKTSFGSEQVDCIRVRPQKPVRKGEAPAQREPGSDDGPDLHGDPDPSGAA